MSAKNWPRVTRTQATVQINAILHQVVGEVDFLVGGKIEHQEKRRIGIGHGNVHAITRHVLRGSVEEKVVRIDPGPAIQRLELRKSRRTGRVGWREGEQEISLQSIGVVDGLIAVAV